jgi:hypothetical protein
MEDIHRRLTLGPDPEVLADIVSGGDKRTAMELRGTIERKRENGRKRRESLRERVE